MKGLLLILAIINLLIVGCDSGGDTPTATVTPTAMPTETPLDDSSDVSSPEDTVDAFIRAVFTSGDVELAKSYWTQRMKGDLDKVDKLEDAVEVWASVNAMIITIKTTITSQTADTAVVQADYDIVSECVDRGCISEYNDVSFALVKDNGQWLIDEYIEAETITTPPETPTSSPYSRPTPDRLLPELSVHFIDVGQGDAILVNLEETEILIDGGPRSSDVVDYLRDYVDGSLEVMVATHPHADHIGGLIEVLEQFEVNEVWHNGDESDSKTYAEFMEGIEDEGVEVNIARLHDVIEAGTLSFNVLNPANLDGSTNNNSVVLHLQYEYYDFLFMGDAEAEAEAEMIALDILPENVILKVGHHGSNSSTSEEFLKVTDPDYAIYMAGEDNTYGHPHEETIARLTEVCYGIYGTDKHGTIVIPTRGHSHKTETEKDSQWINEAETLKLELSILDSSDNETDTVSYGESMKFQLDITNDTENDITAIYFAMPVRFTVFQSGEAVWNSYRVPIGIQPAPAWYDTMVFPANETVHQLSLWDHTDMDFSPVSTGTYMVRAVFTTYSGNLEDEDTLVPHERELMAEFSIVESLTD